MKNRRVHIAITVAAVMAVVTFISIAARTGRGQSQKRQTDTTVKPTVRVTERANATSRNPSPFTVAAETNRSLRTELTWTFGGKSQHGWYLYDALISQTLNSEDNPSSPDFAAALASWQKKRGLNPTGVLDEESLMAMIGQWQSSRMKNRAYATPDQLITPAPSEFYDPERVTELRQVDQKAYSAYRQMLAAALADPTLHLSQQAGELAPNERFFKIVSAFRSREYQDQLRRKSPNAGSAGLAVNSPHFTGKALDIYVGGDPVDTKDENRAIQVNTPVYRWLVRNAERFGFRPYFYEPWHWEYVK